MLRITRDLVTNNVHRDRIHIISANSGHIVRVLCELPILFYAYFHSVEYPHQAAFSSYIANLKSTYALCLARDMGLPIDHVVLSCRPKSTVLDFCNKGEYQAALRNDPCKEEFRFVHSNMERCVLQPCSSLASSSTRFAAMSRSTWRRSRRASASLYRWRR